MQMKQQIKMCYWTNCPYAFSTGIVLVVGTYIKFRIFQCLQGASTRSKIPLRIDDLILFEQKVNLLNAPLILLQLLRILFPFWMKNIFGNIEFCCVWFVFAITAMYFRAIGGLGIAGVRQVLLYVFYTKPA